MIVLLTSMSFSPVKAQTDESLDEFLKLLFDTVDEEIDVELYEDFTVTSTDELESAVQWMYESNLTKFDNVNDFEPNTSLSREAASKFFGVYATEFLQKSESNTYPCNFTDKANANQWLLANIIQSCRLWLFKWADGEFLPKRTLTNAQAITVLVKALEWEQASIWNGHRALPFYYKAKDMGLLEWLTLRNSDNLDNHATRWEIAIMMYRTKEL